eukprot:2454498-Rhodomonas_salina.2
MGVRSEVGDGFGEGGYMSNGHSLRSGAWEQHAVCEYRRCPGGSYTAKSNTRKHNLSPICPRNAFSLI